MTNTQRQISNADKCQTPNAKRTTLSWEYVCNRCGEPAMITTGGAGYLCPSCGLEHLKRQDKLVIDPDNWR